MQTLRDTTKLWDEQMMIGLVRMHANANYNNGWDWVVECWSDGDILEYLSQNKFDLPETIKAIQDWVNFQKEKEEGTRW